MRIVLVYTQVVFIVEITFSFRWANPSDLFLSLYIKSAHSNAGLVSWHCNDSTSFDKRKFVFVFNKDRNSMKIISH